MDAHTANSYVEIIPENNAIVGWTEAGQYTGPEGITGYFTVKFDRPFSSYGTWDDGGDYPDQENVASSSHSGGWVSFSGLSADEVVMAKASKSFISIDQAWNNLNNEMPAWDFAGIKLDAEDAWDEVLSKIEITGGTENQKTIFYTVQPSITRCLNRGLCQSMVDTIPDCKSGYSSLIFSP